MVGLFEEPGRKTGLSVVRRVAAKVTGKPVDLDQISTAVHHGCMDLPQEVIDYIMDMIQDDLLALKTCSLACKSMFASTRHLIHQTLWLTPRNNERVLTRGVQFRYLGWNSRKAELHFLSHMGEHGFLQYTRKVQICMPHTFTPDTLLPHIHHFQSLDHVHNLTIERYDPTLWVNHYSTYFVHFYPTLTSLTLTYPLCHYRLLLRFVVQFPNLENLCLEWVMHDKPREQQVAVPARIDRSPPLRGHLRLAGVSILTLGMEGFIHELPTVNFRSVRLHSLPAGHAQHVLNACAHTLEDLTIIPSETGHGELEDLQFTQNAVLRQFILRMSFRQVPTFALDMLLRAIPTITSPVFCEFVLELTRVPPRFPWAPWMLDWGRWERIDRRLGRRFSGRGDFRLVIRTGELGDQEMIFQERTKEAFSFLAGKGCIRFEISLSVEQYWR